MSTANSTFLKVRFKGHLSLGRVDSLLREVGNPDATHEEQGRALDKAIDVFKRMYAAAKRRGV
jgi:hypothetical protein